MKKALIVLGLLVLFVTWSKTRSADPSSTPASTVTEQAAVTAPAPSQAVVEPSAASSTPTTQAGAGDPEQVPESTQLPASTTRLAETQTTAFMRSYARPPAGLASMAWWDTVRPFLTEKAAARLRVQPATVPFRTMVAPPTISRGSGAALVATVRTDAGVWLVVLYPTSDERLLVDALTPAPAIGAHSSSPR